MNSFTAAQLNAWTHSYNGNNGGTDYTMFMLHLPEPKVFVPTDFNLRCSDTPATASTTTVGTDRETHVQPNEQQALISGPTMLECIKIDSSGGKSTADRSNHEVNSITTTATVASTTLPRLPGTALVVWHKQDHYWRVPKLSVMISLESALSCISPLNIALTELLSLCLKEKLSAYSYYADCAGLNLAGLPQKDIIHSHMSLMKSFVFLRPSLYVN